MSLRKSLLAILLATVGLGALPARTHAQVAGWQKGMTFPGWYLTYSEPQTMTSFLELVGKNINWVCLIPDWVMSGRNSNTIYADQSNTPRDDTLINFIQQVHNRGIKVFLKPHVDPLDGTWRGDIQPTDVNAWFNSYRTFILHYAQIAAQTGVEQFCVGTELVTMSRPTYTERWRSLIAEIRSIYKGPLTYAANHGAINNAEYATIQFWDALDYIGIDAYFPLSDAYTPTVEQIKAGWFSYTDQYGTTHRWVDEMKSVAQKWGKKVIFTEVGYVNRPYAGYEHWANPGPNVPDTTGQNNCVEGLFQVFDQQSWMIGTHWWWWSPNPNDGGPYSTGMWLNRTPAADTIARWYGKTDSGVDTTPPSTPSALTAQPAGTSQINLSWAASTDNVGVTGYYIYRNGVRVGTSTTTSYSDTGLAAGTTYTYRVSAVDAAGNESAQCTAVSAATATPGDTQAPSVPTGLTASAVNATQIALRWNASTDNVGVAGYVVYRDGTKVANTTTTAYTDSGLSAGTTYQYQVAAFDAAGNTSALSAAVSGTTIAANTPTGYDFESGIQGWTRYQAATSVFSATAVKYQGTRSLGVTLSKASASNPGYVMVRPDTTLTAGKTVTFQVYLQSTRTNVVAKAYVQDATWAWVATGAQITLKPNAWTQLAVTVPASAQFPLNNIGVQFLTTGGAAYSGNAYVDDVRWDGAASDPPATATLRFDFENGTQGWVPYQAATNVWQANYLRYQGTCSLGAWLEGASGSNPGYVLVKPDTTMAAGKTVTLWVYLDSAATNVVAKAYVQDASYAWVATGADVALAPRTWTQLTVTVPGTAKFPLNAIGVQFRTASGSAVRSSIYVDDVRW